MGIKFYLFITTILFSCRGREEQLNCFNKSLVQLSKEPNYIQIRTSFEDTLKKWIKDGLNGVQVYKNLNWSLDEAVFFNEAKNKALLLILERDTSLYQAKRFESDSLTLTTLDYVKFIYADLEKEQWHFYYKSLPSLVVQREKYNISIPLSFEKLSEVGRLEVLRSYYKNGSCVYNPFFFDRWNIINLKEKDKKLKSKQ